MFYILATSFLILNSQGNAKFKTKFLLGDCGSAASEPKATELIHADANKVYSVAQQCQLLESGGGPGMSRTERLQR